MNRFILFLASLGVAASAFGDPNPTYVEREVLVKYRTSSIILPAGATVKKSWPQIGVRLIRLRSTMTTAQGLQYFRSLGKWVVYAEPNLKRSWTRVVNDPLFGQQYAMPRIKAPQAWDLGIGLPSTVVAVLDSGFELTHVDMAGKFVAGFDFIDNDPDPTWVSEPHGVSTAGCVAPATDNGVGIAGVGFNCRVMPIRVGDFFIPTDASISGMMFAADNGAKVINMSYGGPGASQAEQDAVNYAWGKGLVVVASAGNDGGTDKNYPAGYDNVIAVAASDANDQMAGFSTHGDWVHVAAPGVAVLTTAPGNSYGPADGTSFSGPITAGLAGLLFAFAQPGTPNTAIRNAILNTADPVGNWVNKGRINAFEAMKLLEAEQAPGIEVNANSIQTVFGMPIFGDTTTVSMSDDIYYQIGSNMLGTVGQAATAQLNFTVPANTNRISINLEAVAGIAGGTNNVWLWNWNTSKYDLIGSTPLVASGNVLKTFKVLDANVPNYIGVGGEVILLARGHLPYRPLQFMLPPPFTYKIDLAQLLVKQSN